MNYSLLNFSGYPSFALHFLEATLISDDCRYNRTLLMKLQEQTHFGNNIYKIFIKLNSTKTIFIKYEDNLQYPESTMLMKNSFKNARPQRLL